MRCAIIAGSPETNSDFIKKIIKSDDYVICADKGYLYAKKAGIAPNLIVGDFDSYNDDILDDCEIIKLNTHKDDTDTVHSIDVAFNKGFTDFVILGALGGRTDHSIANISALQYIYSKGGSGVLLSETERIEFLSVGRYVYKDFIGKTFSVFPFGCTKVCISEIGVEYPLDRYFLESSVPLGISNEFIAYESVIEIYDGNAILIINLSNI